VSATDPHQVFHRTIEAVWRIESARVIAGLTRLTRDDLLIVRQLITLESLPAAGIGRDLLPQHFIRRYGRVASTSAR
jgi:hypothetical protein